MTLRSAQCIMFFMFLLSVALWRCEEIGFSNEMPSGNKFVIVKRWFVEFFISIYIYIYNHYQKNGHIMLF